MNARNIDINDKGRVAGRNMWQALSFELPEFYESIMRRMRVARMDEIRDQLEEKCITTIQHVLQKQKDSN